MTDDKQQRTGRPRGTGARFVRVDMPRWGTPRLHIGRALWQEIGSPRRLDVQRRAGTLYLVPASSHEGYSVGSQGNSVPKISLGHSTLDTLGLVVGYYAAQVEAGMIVVEVD